MDLEKMIQRDMEVLGISRQEAIEMIAKDVEIDRMTATSEIDGDLSKEQRKNAKGARQADRKPGVFKFDSEKRKRSENSGKRSLIDCLNSALVNYGAEKIEVTNAEREIVFFSDGVKYKVVLSAPRS